MSPPQKAAFQPHKTLRKVEKLFERQLKNKGLDFVLKNNIDDDATLESDENRLLQIINNLVGNVLKFTSQGSITIESSYEQNSLSYRVTDTGPGTSDAFQSKIFEPFSQEDNSSTRQHGGAGLGLAISRNLARSMGGDLELQSSPNKGSLFIATIPAKKLESQTQKQKKKPQSLTRHYSALVVDDDAVNLKIAQRQLSLLGLPTELANSGQEALLKTNDQNFDIIFMDLQMPQLDGIQVTQLILENGQNPNNKSPIMAFTAHVGAEEREKCFNVGMRGFLNKPLQRQKLIDIFLDFEAQ